MRLRIQRYIAFMSRQQHNTIPDLDPDLCRRARLSRDPRFDGEFYLAVHTTGIYCRPICAARAPAEWNVSYFRSAEQASAAGFRPCLRCRPESAPHSPAWNGTSTTVERALQMIRQGALNDSSLPELAQRLGIGERYLRKLFERELGVSPTAVAINQRLLFAKKLLAETAMPVTEIAYAAGFGSVRRFNSAVRSHFKLPPSALRHSRKREQADAPVRLQLQYRPPYDWQGVAGFFSRHAVAGVEMADSDQYQRNIDLNGRPGHIRVWPARGKNALLLELHLPDHSLLMPVVATVRRMFDLDANPAAIQQVLSGDQILAPLLQRFPGIRSPGYSSLYEAAIRGIVGQQISTTAARNLLSGMACSDHTGQIVFPGAAAISALDDSHFRMPGRRRDTLRTLSEQFHDREDELDIESLAALHGVGPWTIAMAAMRGSGQPDSFPVTDLGLVKAWSALAGDNLPLRERAMTWRPWRSYAANLLWRSLAL